MSFIFVDSYISKYASQPQSHQSLDFTCKYPLSGYGNYIHLVNSFSFHLFSLFKDVKNNWA